MLGFRIYEADAADVEILAQKKGFANVSEYLRHTLYTALNKPIPVRVDIAIPFKALAQKERVSVEVPSPAVQQVMDKYKNK